MISDASTRSAVTQRSTSGHLNRQHGIMRAGMKFLLRHLARPLRRPDVVSSVCPDVAAAVPAAAPDEAPWRSCVCAIESDARDGLNLVNVCAILH